MNGCQTEMFDTPTHTSLFAIDPSIGSLGLSLHINDIPIATVLVQQKHSKEPYHRRAFGMARFVKYQVESLISEFCLNIETSDVLIESPTNWFNQRAIASKDSEDVQRLYFVVGTLIGTLQYSVSTILVVSPSWKGQQPKTVMQSRAVRYAAQYDRDLPDSVKHDAAEALLLGRFGVTNREVTHDDGEVSRLYKDPIVRLSDDTLKLWSTRYH